MQNLQISIPVTIVAGLVFILLVWALITCERPLPPISFPTFLIFVVDALGCCRRSKGSNIEPTLAQLRHERLGSSDRAAGLRTGPLRPLQLGQPR